MVKEARGPLRSSEENEEEKDGGSKERARKPVVVNSRWSPFQDRASQVRRSRCLVLALSSRRQPKDQNGGARESRTQHFTLTMAQAKRQDPIFFPQNSKTPWSSCLAYHGGVVTRTWTSGTESGENKGYRRHDCWQLPAFHHDSDKDLGA